VCPDAEARSIIRPEAPAESNAIALNIRRDGYTRVTRRRRIPLTADDTEYRWQRTADDWLVRIMLVDRLIFLGITFWWSFGLHGGEVCSFFDTVEPYPASHVGIGAKRASAGRDPGSTQHKAVMGILRGRPLHGAELIQG
jgi:hypothetical protein